jgi:hypothetical protein
MNQQDARQRVADGITYEEVSEILYREFDGAVSTEIPSQTKAKVVFMFRGCIDKKKGMIHPDSHDAVIAELVLMEFEP